MKTPFKILRGLGLHRHHDHHRHNTRLDELSQASQDMQDMKDCYDSLLSAAAATANSAYEFSESLREMGDCLLEKTSLNDDEDSGRVLLMLGKAQFEIQKLVDNYRSHIARTITVPSESLLNELRIVEDMKRQCDEKRMLYDEMKIRHKDKRRLGSSKGEYVSSHQLRAAQEEFNEDAILFVFRMKSLKRGQSRSLLTQAARHHAAQICFFRKALKSLEAIEPDVKLVTEQQHIDYQFSGLEDDDRDSLFLTDDEDDEDESDDDHDMHEDGEATFDHQRSDQKNEVSSSGNSMELDSADLTFPQVASLNSVKENMHRKPLWNSSTFVIELNAGSKSAPLYAASNIDPTEKFKQMRQSSARKLNTYVLPTPLEKNPRLDSQGPQPTSTANLWHSSPLEIKKYENILRKEKFSGPIVSNTQSVLKENGKPAPLPSLLKEGLTSTQIDPCSSFSAKKIKRYAFSGPLAGSAQPNKSPLSASGPIGTTGHAQQSSGPFLGTSSLARPASTTKLSSLSASFVSSPKISELHELPRPPANLASKKPLKAGFSAPLVTFKGGPDYNVTNKSAASTLPVPPEAIMQIQSIPIESQNFTTVERIVSPPPTPISIKNRSGIIQINYHKAVMGDKTFHIMR